MSSRARRRRLDVRGRVASGSLRVTGWAVLLAVCAAGVAGLVATAADERRDLAFGLGVPITRVAVALSPGSTACQRDIRVLAPFRAVELTPRVLEAAAPALAVRVLDRRSGKRLGAGTAAGVYPDNRTLPVRVGRVTAGRRIDVCVTNRGDVRVGLEGGKAEAARRSELRVDGRRYEVNALSLRFLRLQPRSVLSDLPLIFKRAAMFRPAWVGAWTFWALGVLVAVGVPLALARALAMVEARPER